MLEDDNKKRILFSKTAKRLALFELARGTSVEEIFQILFERKELKSDDKNYVSKLFSKWRNEMYKNKEVLNFLNQNLDDEALMYEIANLETDFEQDEILNLIDLQMKKLP